MPYETIIGLEVHAQLLTRSKMFCGCSSEYASAPPNTHVCPVCLGMPGVLPVINRKAIEFAVMTALALHCTISEYVRFDRKNYPYPDLMKGYQISQYDHPIGVKGWMTIGSGESAKKVGITRVHMEEDVAKLLHRVSPDGETYSLVDVNRAGVPLMEIVSEPDITSPEEARQYLVKLRSILQYLAVSTGNMEEGSFRCDANVSIRPAGTTEYLTKVEVKNMNSFKAVFRALEYEARRQEEVLERGEKLVQETRGWLDDKGITVSQRSKEYAHDYRYFPEPDLPPLTFDRVWVDEIKAHLPEMPEARRERFMSRYGLGLYDADLLTATRATGDFFESCVQAVVGGDDGPRCTRKAKEAGNWILGDFSRLLNLSVMEIQDCRVRPEHLAELLDLIEQGSLTGPAAKVVFQEMFDCGKPPGQIVAEKGLEQISDRDEIIRVVRQTLAQNAKAASDLKSGKEQAMAFLIGQAMRATKGRAQPSVVKDLIMAELEEKNNA